MFKQNLKSFPQKPKKLSSFCSSFSDIYITHLHILHIFIFLSETKDLVRQKSLCSLSFVRYWTNQLPKLWSEKLVSTKEGGGESDQESEPVDEKDTSGVRSKTWRDERTWDHHGNPQPSFSGLITHILGVQNLRFSWVIIIHQLGKTWNKGSHFPTIHYTFWGAQIGRVFGRELLGTRSMISFEVWPGGVVGVVRRNTRQNKFPGSYIILKMLANNCGKCVRVFSQWM